MKKNLQNRKFVELRLFFEVVSFVIENVLIQAHHPTISQQTANQSLDPSIQQRQFKAIQIKLTIVCSMQAKLFVKIIS